jgi:hypothetical protein
LATSASDSGISLINLKRLGGWRSDSVACSYVDNSIAATVDAAKTLAPLKIKFIQKDSKNEETETKNEETETKKEEGETETEKEAQSKRKNKSKKDSKNKKTKIDKEGQFTFNFTINN